jgi:D-glycero-alpha-D-manno-heptose-7-phosphate kinase
LVLRKWRLLDDTLDGVKMFTICRTPLRVSLFGGGTDYPAYFEHSPGAVIGFSIDKYIYISALELSAFVNYRTRLAYSIVETVSDSSSLNHPMVRKLMEHYKFKRPVDISIQADLPASAGLGSSSAFTVGLIHTLSSMLGVDKTKYEIAREAIFAEQILLQENVGVQDQLHASFGGINRFNFSGKEFSINPIKISGAEMRKLTDWMVLIFTGITRRATMVVEQQLENTRSRSVDRQLREMVQIVDAAQLLLEDDSSGVRIEELAVLLDQSWQLKKGLAPSITLAAIDELYDRCLASGALGGKLCGAGSGGFLLMIVPPERREAVKLAAGHENCVDFRIDCAGSAIIHQTRPADI